MLLKPVCKYLAKIAGSRQCVPFEQTETEATITQHLVHFTGRPRLNWATLFGALSVQMRPGYPLLQEKPYELREQLQQSWSSKAKKLLH